MENTDIFKVPRKVWIKTFGCQMNYHDTERILGHLESLNFTPTEDLSDANLVIFNTCAIRELAANKFYSQLGEMKKLKKDKNGELIVGVGGCVSQVEEQNLLKKHQYLDFVFGTDTLDQVNEILYRVLVGNERPALLEWDTLENYSIETKLVSESPQAFVNIIKGCNNFCSYCIVPYTRGREKSRSVTEIVADVSSLVANKGIQEITLLGQNVNSFGKERGESLSQLLLELEKIDGLHLIRYTTSHPYDLSDDLVSRYNDCRKLAQHLHLPVQSGSDSVLKRMNRKYTVAHYLNLLDKLRKARPDIVISSDIIVGFPNETENEYEETLAFLDMAQFDFIYSYKFSPRAGTAASKMSDLLTDKIRLARLHKLQDYQLKIQEKIRKQLIGQVKRVLVESCSEKNGIKKWMGRSSCNRIIHFPAPSSLENVDLKWNWADISIEQSTALSCQGQLLHHYGKNYPR